MTAVEGKATLSSGNCLYLLPPLLRIFCLSHVSSGRFVDVNARLSHLEGKAAVLKKTFVKLGELHFGVDVIRFNFKDYISVSQCCTTETNLPTVFHYFYGLVEVSQIPIACADLH